MREIEKLLLNMLVGVIGVKNRKHSHDLEKVGLIHSKILALDNT